jgi:hypothetical protein
MAEETHLPGRRRGFSLRDVSGTTAALTSLAVLGAAALVTAPLVFWYRRKRKRVDAMVRQGAPAAAPPAEEPAATDSAPTAPSPEP